MMVWLQMERPGNVHESVHPSVHSFYNLFTIHDVCPARSTQDDGEDLGRRRNRDPHQRPNRIRYGHITRLPSDALLPSQLDELDEIRRNASGLPYWTDAPGQSSTPPGCLLVRHPEGADSSTRISLHAPPVRRSNLFLSPVSHPSIHQLTLGSSIHVQQ